MSQSSTGYKTNPILHKVSVSHMSCAETLPQVETISVAPTVHLEYWYHHNHVGSTAQQHTATALEPNSWIRLWTLLSYLRREVQVIWARCWGQGEELRYSEGSWSRAAAPLCGKEPVKVLIYNQEAGRISKHKPRICWGDYISPPGLGKPLDPQERAGRREIKNVWITLINHLPQWLGPREVTEHWILFRIKNFPLK